MLLKIHPENPNPRNVNKIIECLKNGGVIIYPTDTIYGIGCDIFNQKAVEKIAKIKGVDVKKHNFSFICADLSELSKYTKPINRNIYRVMKRALPGAFTFILNANNHVPKLFKNKKKTVGIRVPKHNVPRLIVELLGRPILSTSILIEEGKPEFSTNSEFIHLKYQNMVDCIIDSGNGGLEPSTVVDCTNQELEIIRKGKGDLEQFH